MTPNRSGGISLPPLTQLRAGIRAELPIVVGVIPFGIIYGVLAINGGLTPAQAQAMSVIVFAGSAQFIGADLIAVGSPLPVIWLTTFVVNLRHLLYSTALGPDLQHLNRRWRWLLAYLLTDEAYAATAVHYANRQTARTHKHWFFLGAGLTLWLSWQLSTAVGVFLGAEIPASWGLDFTLALTFIGLVVPLLINTPPIAAALIAALVAILTHTLPYKLGLILAALAGILAGLYLENRSLESDNA
ncbi:MAG TPA: AzlC family ABC transporter permease [Anaerolineae bacterium]|nr:AzlC family ABC transporter permease [Anaerolineae bacterium]